MRKFPIDFDLAVGPMTVDFSLEFRAIGLEQIILDLVRF